MQHPFDIYELTPELSSRIHQNPVPPHRHDFEELIILLGGKVEHFIDFHRQNLEGPLVIYVAEGKVHQFIPDESAVGWVIKFRNDFLPDTRFHFFSFFAETLHFNLSQGFCVSGMDSLCRLMREEITTSTPNLQAVKHLLAAILAKLESEGGERFVNPAEARSAQASLFYSFLLLLKEHYRKSEGVGFYAERLNTSVRNLNHICRTFFGKSVSEIIETRKLIEARQMLLNTGKSVSEVGYELGYNEKSYFTKVFKSKTGLTPTLFRQRMGLMIS